MAKCKDCVVRLFNLCGKGASEYCSSERDVLMDEARCLAEGHGHVLGEFVKVADYTVWESRCVLCGQVARIDVSPETHAPSVHGDAILVDCPEGQPAPAATARSENRVGLWD